jgi:hypothetical protein
MRYRKTRATVISALNLARYPSANTVSSMNCPISRHCTVASAESAYPGPVCSKAKRILGKCVASVARGRTHNYNWGSQNQRAGCSSNGLVKTSFVAANNRQEAPKRDPTEVLLASNRFQECEEQPREYYLRSCQFRTRPCGRSGNGGKNENSCVCDVGPNHR